MRSVCDPKSLVNRFLLILSFVFTVQYSSADPYYCKTGTNCLATNVVGPLVICVGESMDLYARTTGFVWPLPPTCSNATFQWYTVIGSAGEIAYTVKITGATSNKYTASSEGRYYCSIGCSEGGYNTSVATILVNPLGTNLNVSANPQPQAACFGSQAEFAVGASGGSIAYRWQELSPGGSWKNLLSETSSNLTVTPELADDMNLYRCIVSNGCESVTTISAELSVLTPPELLTEPVSDSVCEDVAAGFSVSVSGAQLVYLWQERITGTDPWLDLSSAGNYEFDQSGNLTIITAAAAMQGYQYRVIVSGDCAPGVDTSLSAQLVIKAAPSVLAQPENDTLCVGDNAYFEVQATGTGLLTYKWQKGGNTFKDWSEEAFLVVENVSLDDNQNVQVLISDNCYSPANSIASDNAKLLVNPPPSVSLGQDKRICTGSTILLNAGSGHSGYRWSNGDSTQTSAVSQQGSYTVTVTDNKGCSAEDAIFIIVDPPVPDLNLGSDTSLCGGSQITLDAGAGFDWYEWSDGSSLQTFKTSITDTYWVKAGNNNTVCEATDTVNIVISEPYAQAEICLITIDQASGKYMIIWERTADAGIAQYNLYREGQWIGSVAYDDLSIFKDLVADPEKRPYRYEMNISDTCGNESPFTPFHIPIFLQYSGFIDGVNLSWTKYQVQGKEVDFDSYSVYKGSDSTQLVPFEENIPTEVSVFIDKDPAALDNTYYYRIAGILSEPCNVSGGSTKAGSAPYTHSLSNMDDNKLRATSDGAIQPESSLSIFPNPASEMATVTFRNPNAWKYTLMITDISGKLVRIVKDISSSDITFRVEDLNHGFYNLTLTGDRIFHGNLIVK